MSTIIGLSALWFLAFVGAGCIEAWLRRKLRQWHRQRMEAAIAKRKAYDEWLKQLIRIPG